MSEFTDFSPHGYQIQQELGQNRAGGRVTYLANSTNTQHPVVIKQFQFARVGASWSGYEAYDREIQLLRCLNHPSIPRYLDSVETPDGLCLVQEYKQAPSLAQPQLFTPEEIKQIAVAVLEVLVYLQQQIIPVIHRDIKPENILVDRQEHPPDASLPKGGGQGNNSKIKVYLVDFGFARMGDGEVAVSSVVKGTLGFMPPEQLFNRQLTKASDLYSLGATLICLLTQTKSNEIGRLIDETYRINFKHLLPKLNPQFIAWLEKMVAPSLKDRFPDAATALEALKPIPVVSSAIRPAMPVSATRIMMQFVLAMLATIGGFAVIIGTLAAILSSKQPDYSYPAESSHSIEPVRQLRANNECLYCDLRGENLEGAKLSHAKLWGADLKGANLENADLSGADLGNANLTGANLTGANLTGAKLEDAKLEDAKLKGAQLWVAKLEGAYLKGAKLEGAKLGGANLERAYIEGAILQDANLENAKLTNAHLETADLAGANVGNAYLEGANLQETNLKGTNLEGVKLWGANLEGANLEGANLEGANLGGAKLEGAKLEGANLMGTTMPDGKIQP